MILFVVNEQSGNGRGRKIWALIEAHLQASGAEYSKIITTSETEAVSHVLELLKRSKLKAVAVVGGDGTLHGLLPVLAGSGIPCGLIPSGSGNDTSRALGIPRHPLKALAIILAGHSSCIDLLESTTSNGVKQLSITAVAVGLDASVASDVNDSRYKKWCNKLGIGSLAYVIGLFRTLTRFKPGPLSVTIDGITHEFCKGWLAPIANVSSYGGGLQICPTALPDDGHLYVCIVHSASVWRILTLFPSVLTGNHIKLRRYVKIVSGRQVTIDTQSPVLAYGDGEPSGETPLMAVIRPRQLVFLTTASG